MFPFLLPLRRFQRKLFFYTKMRFDGNTYAKALAAEEFPFQAYRTDSLLINAHSGHDIIYQYNKVFNLKLASAQINRMVIQPGETFSFYQAIKNADKKQPFKDGLNLVDGKIVGSYAGGLCQLSSMLYWMFLHTPLTITERHGHGIESFPTTTEDLPLGTDATVSEGWLDLKATNNTENPWQIVITFDNDFMYGAMHCDKPADIEYEIFNSDIIYFRKGGKIYQKSTVNRRERDLNTQSITNYKLYDNVCEIGYELPETCIITEQPMGV